MRETIHIDARQYMYIDSRQYMYCLYSFNPFISFFIPHTSYNTPNK